MLPHWTQNFVDVSGSRFHYTRTGGAESGKPVLVLAHGYTDNGLCWTAMARELEAGWDVVLPDARGHGLSERVKPGETLDLDADLAGFIRALGLERPVVGGHSMGAGTTAQMDARFPGLARALILEDPTWFDAPPRRPEPAASPTGEQPDPYQQWLSNMGDFTMEGLIAKGRADSPTWPEIELGPWAESKMQIDPEFVRHVRTLSMLSGWEHVAAALNAPTLLITADHEKGSIVTPEVSARATALCPQIQVAHIPGVGHCIRREAGKAYMDAVKKFLNGLK